MVSMKELTEKMKSIDGLVALPDILGKIKWKEGREELYLSELIYHMEQWSNKLCPKVKFDDFIEKAEMISTKRAIKTFVTKIRYDMPLDIINPDRSEPVEIDHSDDDAELADLPLDENPPPQLNWDEIFNQDLRMDEDLVDDVAPKKIELSNEHLAIPGPSGIDARELIAKMKQVDVEARIAESRLSTKKISTESVNICLDTPEASQGTPPNSVEFEFNQIVEKTTKNSELTNNLEVFVSNVSPIATEVNYKNLSKAFIDSQDSTSDEIMEISKKRRCQ